MKKLSIYLFALLLVQTFVFTGCKDSETVEPAFDTLTKYLVANNLDLPEMIYYHPSGGDPIKFVVAAPAEAGDVPAFLAKYHIIDMRSAGDFANGHLEGAVNAPVADGSLIPILTEAANAGSKPILVVCVSGQTACFTTALLRLAGYPDARALKWGMCGWDNTTPSWNNGVADIVDANSPWNTDAAPNNIKFDAPVLSESGDGESILSSRVATVAAAGFKTKLGSDVLGSPANYYINNYFPNEDYTGFGHFDGAYIINPLSIADDLTYHLDPAGKVVTYCYTGQTSALITAYIRVLGYDGYSLKFGMNGLQNSSDYWPNSSGTNSKNNWGVAKTKDYPVVTDN